jgi:hypothetical protein
MSGARLTKRLSDSDIIAISVALNSLPSPEHPGVVFRQATIIDLFDRLDKASRAASRIGASGLKVSKLINGIYNKLDRDYCKAQYIRDVRLLGRVATASPARACLPPDSFGLAELATP